jgi:uncharacterized protein (DUF433 family)
MLTAIGDGPLSFPRTIRALRLGEDSPCGATPLSRRRISALVFSARNDTFESVQITPAITEVPLATDPQGVIRVGGTRVTLESVVGAFRTGATPEEIAQQFPALALADVYQVIAYFLHHPVEVEAYLSTRQQDAASLRREIEARFDPRGLRERLLARRTATVA